jgi:CHAT domain-containing protein
MAALCLAILSFCLVLSKSQKQPFLIRDQIIAELGRQRPTEGRFLHGFQYARFREGSTTLRLTREARQLVTRFNFTARTEPSSLSKRVQAFLYVTGSSPEKAVALLELEVSKTPADASLLNDLTVAYIERGRKLNSPRDLIFALASIDKAAALNPSTPEFLFNRALVLEKLSLSPEALGAWGRYMTVEDDQGWLMEAKGHCTLLKKPSQAERWRATEGLLNTLAREGYKGVSLEKIVRKFPQAVRLYGEERGLRSWGLAFLEGKGKEAKNQLELARNLGSYLAKVNGDQMLYDSASAIGRASLANNPSRLQNLAEGHKEFGLGLDLFPTGAGLAALVHFQRAVHDFHEGQSPFERWAKFYVAACYYLISNHDKALSILASLSRESYLGPYASLEGRIQWAMGLIHSVRSNLSVAQSCYGKAFAIYLRQGEVENVAYMRFLLSENLEDLGRYEEAWSERFKALSSRSAIITPIRLHNILFNFSDAILRDHKPEVALYYQNAMVLTARDQRNPWAIAEALLVRAHSQALLGRLSELSADLGEVHMIASKVDPLKFRSRLEADALLFESESLGTGQPKEEIKKLTQALKIYLEEEYFPRRLRIYSQRARAYLKIKEFELAELDLIAAIKEIEKERGSLDAGALRVSFLDRARAIYDQMIRLQTFNMNNLDLAFNYLERAHSRTLLEDISPNSKREPLDLSGVERSMPADRVVVAYAVLEDSVVCWVVRRGGAKHFISMVDVSNLTIHVSSLKSQLSLSKNNAVVIAELSWLYDRLIRPIEKDFPSGADITFIPDKALYNLPFSALYNADKHSFLVESHSVSICPSASVLSRLIRAQERRPRILSPKALIIGDPAFDRSLFPHLPRLPWASDEARIIEESYAAARLLIGNAASDDKFRTLAGTVDTIHFGGHYLESSRSDLSMLLLAPSGDGSSGLLPVTQISALNLRRVRLVVLASCSTAAGRVGESEGPISISRSFLAAGALSVVSMLWESEDSSINTLVVDLHRLVAAGVSPANALRRVQMKKIAGSSAVASWANAVVIGL